MRAIIMPGTYIGTGSIIGASTLVNKKIAENSMVVGVPGKVIKNGINWDRRVDVSYEEYLESISEEQIYLG
jgi:acetyltransferase-like isoleucine patch superfamily enzyme